jgi:hypothetical protein
MTSFASSQTTGTRSLSSSGSSVSQPFQVSRSSEVSRSIESSLRPRGAFRTNTISPFQSQSSASSQVLQSSGCSTQGRSSLRHKHLKALQARLDHKSFGSVLSSQTSQTSALLT